MDASLLPFAGALLGTGVLAGLLAGLLGVGGGIVIVPVLFHVFGLFGIEEAIRMHLAVGTSLATIVPTSIVSARSHHAKGAVDTALLKVLGSTVLAGAIAGVLVADAVRGPVLSGVFAVVALLVAANMLLLPEGTRVAERLPGTAGTAGLGGVIGLVSTMMGIGGGTLSVPILSLFNYPIHRAVGTAAAIGLIIAVPGTAGFVASGWAHPALPPLSLGFVNALAVVLIIPTTMAASPWGARLAHHLKPAHLRVAFGVFLAVSSARMVYSLAT